MVKDTSAKAYREEVAPTIGQRQVAVLNAVRRLGEATNSEISRELGWSINRVTPRVFELREKMRLVDVGKRPCRVTGRLAHVWAEGLKERNLI